MRWLCTTQTTICFDKEVGKGLCQAAASSSLIILELDVWAKAAFPRVRATMFISSPAACSTTFTPIAACPTASLQLRIQNHPTSNSVLLEFFKFGSELEIDPARMIALRRLMHTGKLDTHSGIYMQPLSSP